MRLYEFGAIRTAVGGEDTGTRQRLLDAAIELFGTHGFDGVSVRDISSAAGANGAAITYHFGTKDELIRQAFGTIVRPINQRRLHLLDQASANGGRPAVCEVVRALIEPVVIGVDGTRGSYHRFHILAYALRRPFVDDFMGAEHDRIALRFIEALARALPGVGREELWWRYDFLIGALVHILLDKDRGGRVQRLSDGLCRTSDQARVLDQLISFAVAGLTAPAPGLGRTKPAKKPNNRILPEQTSARRSKGGSHASNASDLAAGMAREPPTRRLRKRDAGGLDR